MIWPPSMLQVRVQSSKRRFGVWFPLILFWPPMLLLALALFPIVMILAMVMWPWGWGRPLLLGGPSFFRLFCALRGLTIDVQAQKQRVYISLR
ncbi:MAG: hypothetical protein BZY88_04205 [SAR202 cluster bacterium Io17-Chloro-G9]|nr:MAG: hypothetical protein BZY88_04205 [SAR202 cluster bacterium Io17-Chloro-G9]